jgi:hypothetical protein
MLLRVLSFWHPRAPDPASFYPPETKTQYQDRFTCVTAAMRCYSCRMLALTKPEGSAIRIAMTSTRSSVADISRKVTMMYLSTLAVATVAAVGRERRY